MELSNARLVLQVACDEETWGDETALLLQNQDVLFHSAYYVEKHQEYTFPLDGSELSLLFTNDAQMKQLNDQWRSKNTPTNVLSFPAFQISEDLKIQRLMGDIVVSFETIERESLAMNIPFSQHLSHLLVHGFLHLLGYDHILEDEAIEMENLEREILLAFKHPDPYPETK